MSRSSSSQSSSERSISLSTQKKKNTALQMIRPRWELLDEKHRRREIKSSDIKLKALSQVEKKVSVPFFHPTILLCYYPSLFKHQAVLSMLEVVQRSAWYFVYRQQQQLVVTNTLNCPRNDRCSSDNSTTTTKSEAVASGEFFFVLSVNSSNRTIGTDGITFTHVTQAPPLFFCIAQ